MKRIMIACEESQTICKEFRDRGFEAYSCDIQPCSGGHPEWHYQEDIFNVLAREPKFDLIIAHPPCTYLSYAGNRYFNIDKYKDKAIERVYNLHEAVIFFLKLYQADIKYICIENPYGWICNFLKPTQEIQPYYFGENSSKRTLLWLKNLPLLKHTKYDNLFEKSTHVDKGNVGRNGNEELFGIHTLKLNADERRKLRSKTFPGIAKAMAEQWGDYILTNKQYE